MRYIRTKDGIYEILKESKLPVGNEMYYITNHKNFYSYEVIDKANTIEELCDEFVVIRNNDKYVCGYIGEEPYYLAIEHDGDGHYFSKKELLDLIVYGAIWTDKGLIYVAKMNDKGELELL